MVYRVLNLPELKIVKPSIHERYVRAVKASYGAIVIAFDDTHENTHEPEALRLSKALNKQSTVAAIYRVGHKFCSISSSILHFLMLNNTQIIFIPIAHWHVSQLFSKSFYPKNYTF